MVLLGSLGENLTLKFVYFLLEALILEMRPSFTTSQSFFAMLNYFSNYIIF